MIIVQSIAGGGIVGPASSTDEGIARWKGTGGDELANSNVKIDASDNLYNATSLQAPNIYGSLTPSGVLTLESTTDATKGYVRVGSPVTGGGNPLYADPNANAHVGWGPPYAAGSLVYRDSQKLFFDTEYFTGGIRDTYIQAVPNEPGGQNQHKIKFVLEGNEVCSFFFGGIKASEWLTSGLTSSGSTIRGINGGSVRIRGEFNTTTLQGEKNTSGFADNIVIAKNPFGGGTAGYIMDWYNDTALRMRLTNQGDLSVFSSASETARLSSAWGFEGSSDREFRLSNTSTNLTTIDTRLGRLSAGNFQILNASGVMGGLSLSSMNVETGSASSYTTAVEIKNARKLVCSGPNPLRYMEFLCDNSYGYIQAFRDVPSNETLPFLQGGKTYEIQTGPAISGGSGLAPGLFVGDTQRAQVGDVDRNPQAQFEVKIKTSGTVGRIVKAKTGQTADLDQAFNAAGAKVDFVGADGRRYLAGIDSAPTDGDIQAAQFTFYLDESNDKLMIRVKYADGTTLKTGEVLLT